jgi:hypothetical protein
VIAENLIRYNISRSPHVVVASCSSETILPGCRDKILTHFAPRAAQATASSVAWESGLCLAPRRLPPAPEGGDNGGEVMGVGIAHTQRPTAWCQALGDVTPHRLGHRQRAFPPGRSAAIWSPGRSHRDVPWPGDVRRPCSRMHRLSNAPLCEGTPPFR